MKYHGAYSLIEGHQGSRKEVTTFLPSCRGSYPGSIINESLVSVLCLGLSFPILKLRGIHCL